MPKTMADLGDFADKNKADLGQKNPRIEPSIVKRKTRDFQLKKREFFNRKEKTQEQKRKTASRESEMILSRGLGLQSRFCRV